MDLDAHAAPSAAPYDLHDGALGEPELRPDGRTVLRRDAASAVVKTSPYVFGMIALELSYAVVEIDRNKK
jgi:hypothetical protein